MTLSRHILKLMIVRVTIYIHPGYKTKLTFVLKEPFICFCLNLLLISKKKKLNHLKLYHFTQFLSFFKNVCLENKQNRHF